VPFMAPGLLSFKFGIFHPTFSNRVGVAGNAATVDVPSRSHVHFRLAGNSFLVLRPTSNAS
jgi:hypothetical protein